ncbi:MAG: ABC transporter permease [Clostridiales bacterium]|jgi:peptide/nickel transport system permease protein|nr:ABC transporter permease [Clostridiales bacterium]
MAKISASEKAAKKSSLKRNSQGREVWRRLRGRKLAMISLGAVIFVVLIAVIADFVYPYKTWAIEQQASLKLLKPFQDWSHWLGCDHLGRDMGARIFHGTRVALLIGIGSTFLALFLGTVLACICALYGGKADLIIMRIIDILSSVPHIIISLAICSGLGNGIWQLVTAITIGGISIHTRMVRSVAISVAQMEYVESSMALGGSAGHIMFKHLIPNIMSIIIIQGASNIAGNILIVATLSFIGLGIKPPRPEWGSMLNEGLTYMMRYPFMVFVPGIALVFTSLSINTFGDCLRDAFDPQLKGKA